MIKIKRLVLRINRLKMKKFNFVMLSFCIVCIVLLILVKEQDIDNGLLEKIFWNKEIILKNCSNDVAFERFDYFGKINKNPSKYHVIYIHYLNTNDAIIKENFNFFMHFAHEPCNTDVDFTIILNVDSQIYNQLKEQKFMSIYDLDLFTEAFSTKAHLDRFKLCESSYNSLKNTRLVIRENREGGDLCAYSDMMRNEG
jgi:hypothetical protein